MGRRKIEMKRIENEEARHVCFSKRRVGLFNKASELSILCGAKIAVVAFSLGGKPFAYGHPSVDSIINHFFCGTAPYYLAKGGINQDGDRKQTMLNNLNQKHEDLCNLVDSQIKKANMLEEAIQRESGGRLMQLLSTNVQQMDLQDLQELLKLLKEYEAVIKGIDIQFQQVKRIRVTPSYTKMLMSAMPQSLGDEDVEPMTIPQSSFSYGLHNRLGFNLTHGGSRGARTSSHGFYGPFFK
ncbi:hypothetical protein ACP70R_043086 [Stipagrostis hirtigluma subsp. patula]